MEETTERPRRREIRGMTPLSKKQFFNEISEKLRKEVALNSDEGEAILMAWSFAERPLENLDDFVLALGLQGTGKGLMTLFCLLALSLRHQSEEHLTMLARACEAVMEEEITSSKDVPDFIREWEDNQ